MTNWRTWHRWLGTISGLFLLVIGVSGIWLQIDEMAELSAPPRQPPPSDARDAIDPVALAQRSQQWLARNHDGVAILSLTVEQQKGKATAIVRLADAPRPIAIDLATGRESAARLGPVPGNSFFERLRRLMMSFHTLGIVGPGGHAFGLIAGVILAILGGSGLWLWWIMGRDRARRGRPKWFWN